MRSRTGIAVVTAVLLSVVTVASRAEDAGDDLITLRDGSTKRAR